MNHNLQTKTTKMNQQNQIYLAKSLKEPIIPKQINSIKPTKLNQSIQYYPIPVLSYQICRE